LKNTLNTAKSQRSRLEQGAEMWKEYTQSLERVRAVISRTRFTDEPVTTLAGLQFNIQKITHALNDIQVRLKKTKNSPLNQLNVFPAFALFHFFPESAVRVGSSK